MTREDLDDVRAQLELLRDAYDQAQRKLQGAFHVGCIQQTNAQQLIVHNGNLTLVQSCISVYLQETSSIHKLIRTALSACSH